MKRILFIIQYDSYLKTLLPILDLCRENGVSYTVLFYKQFYKKNWIDDNIKKLASNIDYRVVSLSGIYKEMSNDYDALVFGVIGARLIPKLSDYIKKHKLRTKIISGYVGALLNNNEGSFSKGIRRRAYGDLVWTPGVDAKNSILNTGLLDSGKTDIVPTGLPRFDALYQKMQGWDSKREKDIILFLEQPTYPESKEDRINVITQLIKVAKAYPNKRVLLKPRFALKTGHAHRPKFLMQDFLLEMNTPENLEVTYIDIYELFQETLFALTLSSTAGLESLLAKIPTYFISDYCGNDNHYGSQYFSKTGGVTSFKNICKKNLPDINYDAVQDIMRFDGKNSERLYQSILKVCSV